MTTHFNSNDDCAKKLIDHIGKTIIIGVPLGLGKPIGLLNALFQLAINDKSIHLTIVTGLTLARPQLKNELEKRFIEPILDRVLKDYEDPLYERYRETQQLPDNINVIEFFLSPGKFLHNAYVQQNYISSNYTSAGRDAFNLSVNVLAQQVAPSPTNQNLYSLSCNTDLFHNVRSLLKTSEEKGNKIAIVAEINANLPFMYGAEAEVNGDTFSHVLDTKKYRSLFAVPRDELSVQDHLIGLYTSALIKDNGCLQIGIGKLSNALANALIFRHKENLIYQNLMAKLNVQEKFGQSLKEIGSLGIFDKGLYASTEMLSDEYIQLYQAGILKKRVYDHIGLQKLLNTYDIQEKITPDLIDYLIKHELIHSKLTLLDVTFMKKFNIIKSDINFNNGYLNLPSGESIPADLTDATSKQFILDKCLGKYLKSGKIIHAGFFFGSVDLYSALHNLSYDELQLFEMTSVARTNALLWSPELLELQRQQARFVNSSIMITSLGCMISDGLKNYQELSGVGGQHDFINMASQLKDARSIINCRSTRETKGIVTSNIVWDYPNLTISRYLRDIFVTEYGIADCRSKTDVEVIKSILNITDSRFQTDLLETAKRSGKLPRDYQIPTLFQNNYPEAITKIMQPFEQYCPPYPFGSDLTQTEQTLARALLYLKNLSLTKLFLLTIASLFFFQSDKKFESYLQRMNLSYVKTAKNYLYKKLLKYTIHLLEV